MRVSLIVDKDRVLYAYPQRKFAQKPCTSTCKRPPISSLTFSRDFPPADIASKHRQPKSCGCCSWNLGDWMFGEPFWPKPIVAQGQGRVDCRGRVPGVNQTQGFALKAKKTKAKSAHCHIVLHPARSSVSHAFVHMWQEETKKGGAYYNSPPSRKTQEAPHCHQWSSSLSSILGYCLLHGCCRIGVQPSDHINCDGQRTFGVWQCRHPSIDPVCIVWVERTPGRVWQEKICGKINILISV